MLNFNCLENDVVFNLSDNPILDHPHLNRCGLPIYDEDFCKGLLEELCAQIEDVTQKFLFEQMTSKTYYIITSALYVRLDQFVYNYPEVKSYSFKNYISDIKKEEQRRLEEILESYEEKIHMNEGFIYAIPESGKIIINIPEIIDYITR